VDWVLPDVPRSREPVGLYAEGAWGSVATEHLSGTSQFCRECLADLRVRRLLVRVVTYSDIWRLRLCQGAARAVLLEDGADSYECVCLAMSSRSRDQLFNLLMEGLEAENYVMCGLRDVELVGITADGTFLYAEHGLYEIGPICISSTKQE
jgi:hypothetical protein